jgi:hypothetical protein
MKITVVKNWQGTEEIHKAGCADLKRNSRRPYALAEAMHVEATSLEQIYKFYWECIDDEAVAAGDYKTVQHAWYAWQGEFIIKPCAKDLTPMADPNAEAAPTASPREAKRDLARRLVMAAGSILESADGSEAFLAGMTKTEAAECLASWLHHIPARNDAGDGWAVGILPVPDRSDWR